MPRSALGDFAKEKLAERQAKREQELAQLRDKQQQTSVLRARKFNDDTDFIPYKDVGTDIPALPELLPEGGPEGLDAWNLDWWNITTSVKHVLLLRSVLHWGVTIPEYPLPSVQVGIPTESVAPELAPEVVAWP